MLVFVETIFNKIIAAITFYNHLSTSTLNPFCLVDPTIFATLPEVGVTTHR